MRTERCICRTFIVSSQHTHSQFGLGKLYKIQVTQNDIHFHTRTRTCTLTPEHQGNRTLLCGLVKRKASLHPIPSSTFFSISFLFLLSSRQAISSVDLSTEQSIAEQRDGKGEWEAVRLFCCRTKLFCSSSSHWQISSHIHCQIQMYIYGVGQQLRPGSSTKKYVFSFSSPGRRAV